jgi:hypothetical protein
MAATLPLWQARPMNALDRVWAAVAPAPRAALERTLPPTDLRTLLLGVWHARAATVTPARVVAQWRSDRFVRPSAADPRVLALVEARLWAALPTTFAGVDLSPVAPLGTCSAVATIDQNRVVTTARGTEVVSDPTNALAVEAAVRRRAGAARVDLAACHRVLRAQALDGPGLSAHFRLFALVSSARDAGSRRTEAALLADHLRYWSEALASLGVAARFGVTGYGDSGVRDALPDDVTVEDDPDRTHGRGYYSAALGITVGDVNLGDGGVVPWTAALLGDAKERCVISCVATERLALLADLPSPS